MTATPTVCASQVLSTQDLKVLSLDELGAAIDELNDRDFRPLRLPRKDSYEGPPVGPGSDHREPLGGAHFENGKISGTE